MVSYKERERDATSRQLVTFAAWGKPMADSSELAYTMIANINLN